MTTDRLPRWAAPAVLTVFIAVGAALSTQRGPVVVGSAAVAVAAGWFLQSTGRVLFGVASVAGAAVAVLCAESASNIGWFAVCFLTGWCALQGGSRIGIAYAAASVALFAVEWAVLSADPGWAAWIAGTLFTVVVCLMARRQNDLIEALHQAQAGLADRARVQERNRIARELHDVIAHSLTVSLLHVSTARLAVEEDPAEAVEALAEAERLGRLSLGEVRHAVGLLHEGGDSARAPAPGIGEVPALVEGFRRAGARVSYDVLGDAGRLGATAGLTVYRILQEALTNAARHAPGAEARVSVQVAADRTRLTVDTAGPPGPPRLDGIGLHSMRERAEALGGSCSAGPSASGWRVYAEVPCGPAPAGRDTS